MGASNDLDMGDNPRALLSATRRDVLSGALDDPREGRVFEEKSRIRPIINEELPEDRDIFIKHHPDLYAELVRAVITEEGINALREEDPELVADLQDLLGAE